MSVYGYNVKGLIAPSGTRYVKVTSDHGQTSLVPVIMFSGAGQEALQRLKRDNLPIIGSKDCHALVDLVSKLDDYEPCAVAEKIGWNAGNVFALPDGTLIAPEGTADPETALPVQAQEPETSGTLSSWKVLVAKPMVDQPLLQFGAMFMFAAPLLELTSRSDNFGFELVGIGGRGKSTLQRIITSVAGRTGAGADGHYFRYFDTTLNALETSMVAHADLPLVLEEANLFSHGETARSLAPKFQAFAFKLGSGTMKSRLGNPAGRPVRLLYLSSSNEPLASVIGEDSNAAKAAADRLITIPVPDRETGVLNSVPAGYADAAAFMDALLEAASRSYGLPLRRFLRCLVDQRATDENALRQSIADWMDVFRSRAGPVGANRRVIDAFGLVYAAGKLAMSYGALPNSFQCGPSALACYHLHIGRRTAELSFSERLQGLASAAVQLGAGRLPKLTSEQIAAGLFRREGRHGPELIITEDQVFHYIPDWKHIRNRRTVTKLLNNEHGRKKIRRKIAANHPKFRVFSFKL